jgi:hypothetical protein
MAPLATGLIYVEYTISVESISMIFIIIIIIIDSG